MRYSRQDLPFGELRFHSDAIRGWAVRQSCSFCNVPGPSEALHFPPRVQGGKCNDDTTLVPLCDWCYARAQRYEAPINAAWLAAAADRTLRLFTLTATEQEWALFAIERHRWEEEQPGRLTLPGPVWRGGGG